MRRTLAALAALLLLGGCAAQTDNPTVDRARSAVERGQRHVERAKDTVQPAVQRLVQPHLPSFLRDEPGFDAAAVESYLVSSQKSRLSAAGPVGAASCPSDPALTEEMTVRCILRVAGTPVPFAVTLTDVHTSQVHIDTVQQGVIIPTAKILALISGGASEVSCGQGRLLVGRVGQAVRCTAASGPQTAAFTVTIKDAAGRVAVS